MKKIFIYCLTLFLFVGCKEENDSRAEHKVEIYLLKSFTSTVDQSTTPATVSITNAILDKTPLVTDQDIQFYTKATTTFTLRKEIQTTIQNYGQDKAFAVTVDNKPVYFGKFHPMYLSSMTIGVATISPPFPNQNELEINFIYIEGSSFLKKLDKRNDSQIVTALSATGRLR
ncbi:MAG TPA: hypothetical protein VGB63_07535 [Pedobacter sp.]|jgi:uncharacterized protein YcfL